MKGIEMTMKDEATMDACRIVENIARSIGKDCQIMFLDKCVTVAPPEWTGKSSGKTLYDALLDARNSQ